MALSHQFIWSSTSLMLCFIFSGGRSLVWPITAVSHMNVCQMYISSQFYNPLKYICALRGVFVIMTAADYNSRNNCCMCEINVNSRSTALLDAAAPIPRFWIWYTGWVGRWPSLSSLEGPEPEGRGATSRGVPGFPPSSLALISMIGFSRAGAPLTGTFWDGLDY